MRLRTAIVSLLALVSAFANAAEPRLEDVVPIPLQSGTNNIASFAPDGRTGTVILGWRDNGNAHGYNMFLVLMPTPQGSNNWNVVGFEPYFPQNSALLDSIADAPHAGEDIVRAIRFARGKIDGVASTLVFVANRVIGNEGIPAPTPVDFILYRLTKGGDVGVTADVFRIAARWHTDRRFCNAEMALKVAFGLPLRTSYEGPKDNEGRFTADGCFSDPITFLR